MIYFPVFDVPPWRGSNISLPRQVADKQYDDPTNDPGLAMDPGPFLTLPSDCVRNRADPWPGPHTVTAKEQTAWHRRRDTPCAPSPLPQLTTLTNEHQRSDGGTRSNTHEMMSRTPEQLSYIHQNHEKPDTVVKKGVREFDRGTSGRFLRKAVPRHGGGGGITYAPSGARTRYFLVRSHALGHGILFLDPPSEASGARCVAGYLGAWHGRLASGRAGDIARGVAADPHLLDQVHVGGGFAEVPRGGRQRGRGRGRGRRLLRGEWLAGVLRRSVVLGDRVHFGVCNHERAAPESLVLRRIWQILDFVSNLSPLHKPPHQVSTPPPPLNPPHFVRPVPPQNCTILQVQQCMRNTGTGSINSFQAFMLPPPPLVQATPLYTIITVPTPSVAWARAWLAHKHTTSDTHMCRPHVLKLAIQDLRDASD